MIKYFGVELRLRHLETCRGGLIGHKEFSAQLLRYRCCDASSVSKRIKRKNNLAIYVNCDTHSTWWGVHASIDDDVSERHSASSSTGKAEKSDF